MFHSPKAVKFKYPATPVSPVSPTQYYLRLLRAADDSVISESGRPLPTLDGDGYYVVTAFGPTGITFEDGVSSRFAVSFVSPDGRGEETMSDVFTPGNVPEPPDAPSEVVVVTE